MKTIKLARLLFGVPLAAAVLLVSPSAQPADPAAMADPTADTAGIPDETDINAPVDTGSGTGLLGTLKSALSSGSGVKPMTVPTGGSTASTAGVFGAPVTWPLIPIHVVLLPDGRVMSYGTTAAGKQGAMLIYDVWDPTLGTDANSHLTLPNSTSTDIFCGTQSVMLNGQVLTSGGDLTVNGARNSANNTTTIFTPASNSIAPNTAMTYARWYATLLGLPDGTLAVFGGRQNVGQLTPIIPVPTPEIYNPSLGTWTQLSGATSTAAFGANWWYPRVHVAPGGKIFVLNSTNGRMFYLSTANGGSITASTVTAPTGNIALPTIPFAPGKLLSVRSNQQVIVVDYSTSTPVVTATDPIDQVRFWASGTVMADGRVVVTGGSQVANKLTGVDYQAQIWDPKTGHWTAGASATKPRLYHSNAMLLPDASVLTGGGGAPGPLTNLNAEIYYPPYLYNADGTPATRPTLASTDLSSYDPGATLTATVGPTDTISRMTLVRTGSSTHANNVDQRFIELSFTQTGQSLVTTLPADNTVLVPVYYMLFVINSAGVPSIAKIFPVSANAPPPASFSVSPATLTFAFTQVGATAGAQPVTVTNNGGPGQISGISFAGAAAGSYAQTNTCTGVIAAGATCTISVSYTPVAAGAAKATLNVVGAGSTQSVTITGTGSEPFTVSPATVTFPATTVGTSSAPLPVTVTNAGGAALPINSITLGGSAPAQFSQTNNCGTSLPAGGTCTVNVVYTPAGTGYNWAKVIVASPGNTQSSKVGGNGS